MKKIFNILYLFIFVVIGYLLCDKIYAYDMFKVGDEVTFHGESYHVISNSDSDTSYITILKDEPLTINDIYKYGVDENNHLFVNEYFIDGNTDGVYSFEDKYGGIAYYTSEECSGTLVDMYGFSSVNSVTINCSNNYLTSDVKKVIDNWSKQYENELINISGYKARLISLDEIFDNLGAELLSDGTFYNIYSKNNEWFSKNGTPFWIDSSIEDDNSKATIIKYRFHYGGGIYKADIYSTYGVVRPVINVEKNNSNLISKYINKQKLYKEYKKGNVIMYKDTLFYILEDSDEYTDYLYLLRAYPLNKEQINKYGNNYVSKEGETPFYTSNFCDEEDFSECTNDYKKSDIKKIVDNYVNNELDINDLVEIDGYKSKLLDIRDLAYYGAIKEEYAFSDDIPSFLLPKNNNDYWLINPKSQYSLFDISKISDKSINDFRIYEKGFVRPVIYLKKSALKNIESCKTNIKLVKESKYITLKNGEKIEYNGDTYYVIGDSKSYQKYVTLLKEKLLTTEEVKKYNTAYKNTYVNYIGVFPYMKNTCKIEESEDNTCTLSYEDSDIKKIVDKWVSQEFTDDELVSVEGYKSRLLYAGKELNDTNFELEFNNTDYNYYLMNGEFGGFKKNYYDIYYMAYYPRAVRPVVNIKKEVLGNLNISSFGDKITYKNNNYYVVNNDFAETSYLTLLKAEPINLYQVYTYDEENMFNVPFSLKNDCFDDGSFPFIENKIMNCKSDFDGSYIKNVLNNWSLDRLNMDDLVEVDGYKVRLITTDELFMYLGYDKNILTTQHSKSYKVTDDVFEWVYGIGNYWTMSGYGDYDYLIYYVNDNGNVNITSRVFDFMGVRPVINLNKEVLENGYSEYEYYVCEDEVINDEIIENNEDNPDISNKPIDKEEIINVENTLKGLSKILIIISILFIISGLLILGYSYLKSKKQK